MHCGRCLNWGWKLRNNAELSAHLQIANADCWRPKALFHFHQSLPIPDGSLWVPQLRRARSLEDNLPSGSLLPCPCPSAMAATASSDVKDANGDPNCLRWNPVEPFHLEILLATSDPAGNPHVPQAIALLSNLHHDLRRKMPNLHMLSRCKMGLELAVQDFAKGKPPAKIRFQNAAGMRIALLETLLHQQWWQVAKLETVKACFTKFLPCFTKVQPCETQLKPASIPGFHRGACAATRVDERWPSVRPCHTIFQWIGGKNDRKVPIFHGEIGGFRFRLSLKPIQWNITQHQVFCWTNWFQSHHCTTDPSNHSLWAGVPHQRCSLGLGQHSDRQQICTIPAGRPAHA